MHSTINIEQLEAILKEHADAFDRFERLLVSENEKYNLTRITEHHQVHVRHWLDSLICLPTLDTLAQGKKIKIADAGSGAGMPGLPLAVARPDWNVVSIEATDKKVHFQQLVKEELELTNFTTIHGRAEDLAKDKRYRETFDAVTARALAPLPVLAELTLAFLKEGGKALFWKGPDYQRELDDARPAIEQMGASVEMVQSYVLNISDSEKIQMALIVCTKERPAPATYPRAFGIIKKQPFTTKTKR